ncbi:MAG TPA: ABC transporter permease [Chitinophagaceae bacterium]|nr:ABC transporter permease [Chitinophagaceae bacterium]
MRTLKFLLQKEFRQIFRDRIILRMIFLAPVIQLLILPLAANYEVKNISLAVVDNDHSTYSQKLISKITSSGYFKLTGYKANYNEAYQLVADDKADLVLEIPNGFERNLVREDEQKLFIAVNAINGTKANLGGAYLGKIISSFNNTIRTQLIQPDRFNPLPQIEVASTNWFNPLLNYSFFMVPGILVLLVTMVAAIQSALNIVREKEIGTIEQINVTPIKKYHFILGKLIPFWILGIIVFTLGLLLARFVYGIVPAGNIALLYFFLSIYLFALLGFGLLISTFCNTQQQAMSVAFFFIMIFNLMSGLFTSIDSMPGWAKIITDFIPVSYFIEVMRMIVLKGSGLADIKYHLAAVFALGVVLNTWAVLNYRKTS